MPFEELSCVRHFLEFIEIWMRLHLFKAVGKLCISIFLYLLHT